MKRQLLLLTVLLMGLTTVTATETNSERNSEDLITRYRYAQPIMFVERGVEFMIFPDGSFDFNTNVNYDFHSNNNFYYRSSKTITRRSSINTTFGAPLTINRVRFSTSRNRGVLIQHDRDGKVRRIGNVFINYDQSGKVKRVGSIYMRYNRGNGRLLQVGGLQVRYNHWGEIIYSNGSVSPFLDVCGICGTHSCNTNHSFGNSHIDVDWNNELYSEDFYYYKHNDKIKKQKKIK